MNKFKLGSLIFIISITGFSSSCLAEEKEKNKESLGSSAISSLAFDSTNLSKLNKLYPELKVTKLTGDIKLSEKEQAVVAKVKEFIDTTSFEQVINVFSDSLYEDIPVNDKFYGQKYEITDLKDIYEDKIKKESATYAKLIVSVNHLEEYNQESVKQQIILVSYFTRWGSFSNGKHMFWNELYNPQSAFMTKEQSNQLNNAFIQLFSENPKQYLASKNVDNTFKKASSAIGKNDSYKQFVEHFLVQNGITNYSEWFYNSFKGRMYKDHYEGTSYDVGIWNRSDKFNSYLPYLLNQTDTTNLMIGESRGEVIFLSPYNYQNDFDVAEKVLRKAMLTITNILELYDRTIEDKELMNVDQLIGQHQRTVLDQGRNWLEPEDSLSYELYRVAGYTGSHPNNAAVAGAGAIQMQGDKLDAEKTVAHELAHELDSLFNANKEYFSTYTHNYGRQNSAYLNIFADGENIKKSNEVVANTSVLQMQSKEDLVSYVKNMEDMVYVLDGIIATKVLELPIEEQVKYIKIAQIDGENGMVFTETPGSDKVQTKDLTVEELKQLNIKTIEDLIDNDAVIMQPNDTNKNILRNHGQGYGTTLTYSSFFLINGKPVHHNHRMINTLLAEGGWEMFKNFNLFYNEAIGRITDSTLNLDEKTAIGSSEALKKVYNDENITYRELVRRRYMESLKNFKEKGLLGESYDSVLMDLSSIELANFYSYKFNMMNRYLNLTNDFSNSVFEVNEIVRENVSSYTELYETVERNPYAEINLIKSFNVEGKHSEKVLPSFHGSLNGNGHTVSASTHPLFKEINDANIKNLILDKANIVNTDEMTVGGITIFAENSKINNVHVTNSKIHSTSSDKVISGGLVGQSTGTTILNSTVQDTDISGAYVGGITGAADRSQILNVYTTGKIKNSVSGDIRIGGIIGNGYNYTEVKNSYSTMEVTNGNGMLGSDYTYGNKHISFENSISLANLTSTDKFKYYNYGVSLIPWKNNFEIDEYEGKSSTDLDNLDVTNIGIEKLNQEFFAKQLTWKDEAIWGIEKTTSEKELPYLKNSDPRNKEETDLSKLILKTERKEIYVGEKLDLTDLIEEVRDKEGKIVDKEEVTIIGQVDTTKPGETVVTYQYNGIEKKATIVVKENKTSVQVHDSMIYVGDDWSAKDNFDGAIDKEGKEVPFEKITVGGDNVDTTKAGRYEVLYSYEEAESKAVITVKENQTAYEKETKITFLEDNETGTIVDPDSPEGGVEPVDPTNPNGAELMISYASNLNFGMHKSKTGTTFNALADKVWTDEKHTSTREVTPFVATKDSRGAARKGWVLTAKQDSEFVGENTQPLKGAEISLSNLSYADLMGSPSVTGNQVVLGQEAKEVAKAGTTQGVGAWSLALGRLDGEVEQGEVKMKTTSGITLSLPSNTVVDTQTYYTTVTWELATDPTI